MYCSIEKLNSSKYLTLSLIKYFPYYVLKLSGKISHKKALEKAHKEYELLRKII